MTLRHRILIVDRDADCRADTAALLEGAGYRVYQARTRNDALPMMYRTHPHLVLLELTDPAIESRETLDRIRDFTGAPVILTARRTDPRDEAHLMELGGDDLLAEPYSARDLFAEVKKFLPHTDLGGLAARESVDGSFAALLESLPPLRFLGPRHLIKLNRALLQIGRAGEIRLVKRNGRLGCIRPYVREGAPVGQFEG